VAAVGGAKQKILEGVVVCTLSRKSKSAWKSADVEAVNRCALFHIAAL
jgi:hypothetical protein